MKLLLAEDDRSLSRAVTAILEHSHYTVDAVGDGQEALDYLAAGGYDGVILDIMMPKKDGMEVLRTLRGKGDTTPVLLLTAKSEVDDKVEGLDAGANDYLTKPFAMKELLARIRAMTRTRTGQATARLQAGNLTLDRADFTLTGPGGRYTLANREFQLMELLMSNPHRLLSTQQLFEKVWGYGSDAELSVVWVYISYLRKKLAALEANVQIKATRNLGYSLEDKP